MTPLPRAAAHRAAVAPMPASYTAARCLLTCAALASAVPAFAADAALAMASEPEVNAAALMPAGSCPADLFGADLPQGKDAIRSQLLKLSPLAEACDMRADFHAYRGALLLTAGWPQDAATALEKALLLNPELAGAQLDFAQALAQQGQRAEARELVRQVTERADIQPDLKQWLRDGLAPGALAAATAGTAQATATHAYTGWTWAGLVQSSLGHETNLASATHTTSLTLYLTSGPVEVPLADSERPRSGAAFKVLVAAQGVRPLGDGELRLNVALQGRRAEGQPVADNQLAEGAAAYALPMGPGVMQGSVGAHSFNQRGVYSYKDQAYSLKYEPFMRLADCKGSLALGRTEQRYISSPSLDGNYQHLRLEAACRPQDLAGGEGTAESILGLATGQDTPLDATRPGGIKNRLEVYARHERNLVLPMTGVQGTLTAWYRYSKSRDEQVFSGLLGTEPTQTRRNDAGLGYWLPVRAGWSVGLDVESTSQKSTNTLLNIKNLSVYGGLRWAVN
jgi:tetratricopeptide (TPR) repeat protein